MNNILLQMQELYKSFPVKAGPGKTLAARAVDGVTLAVAQGEVLGLVGESGCGKSTLGRLVLGLLPPTSGAVSGERTSRPRQQRLQSPEEMQIIFQDSSRRSIPACGSRRS
jgi:ABC-type oligopeptide transport system ATPase subunit